MSKLKIFWYSFQKSLLDFSYYKEIAKASYWFSFKYLLFLLVCLSLVRSVQLGILYSTVRKNIPSYIAIGKKEIASLYPKELEIRISNGKLYTNVQEPYVIEFPKIFGDMQGQHMVVIDTKGVVDNYPKYHTVVLATRQAVVFPEKKQGNTTTTQLYYFSELKRSLYMDYFEYSKIVKSFNPFIAKLPQYVDTVVFIVIVLLPFVGGILWQSSTLFGLLFLTLIVFIVGKFIKSPYGYKTLYRMGMHGITWSILFSFLLDITNQKVDYLYNLIFIAWMIFVLVKNKETKIVV